jgi:hypothetical protein
VPKSRTQDLEELLEACYHYRQAGELDAAVEVTAYVCAQLDTWDAWRREEQLGRETLTWVPERSTQTAAFRSQLGRIAQVRKSWATARAWRVRMAILVCCSQPAGR